MPGSDLTFRVNAQVSGAVGGFKRLAASLKPVAKESEAANKSLAKLNKAKVAPKVDDKQIAKVEKEIQRLHSEMGKALSLNVHADTRDVQRKIRSLQSTLKTLKNPPPITPTVKTGALAKIKSAVSGLGDGLQKVGGQFADVFKSIGVPVLGALGVAAVGLATGIGAIAVKSLALADAADQSRNTFKLFLGSFGKADSALSGLQKFAATTPFEFPEVKDSAKRLLGVGQNAKQAQASLKVLGDTASAFGTDLEGVTTIWAQMLSAGKVTAEDMNQLVDRGIPAWGELSKAMGKPVPELKKLSSEGKLGKDALEALYQQLGKDYAGQMKTQSGTFSGMVSNFKDAVSGLLTDIGNAILPFAKALMPAIQAAFGGFGDKLKSNLPAVIDGIAGALKGLLDLPGQVLRGLALVSMGFADMVADIQSSAASLMSGLGQSLMNIPGMQDFAGSLIAGATNLTVAAAKTRDAGKTTFDNLIAGADKADAAVKPVKDSIEKARQAAQAGIQLKLDLAPIDKDIATAKTKINQIQQNIKNPKLKADKDYWNQQLREAQGDLKKLRDKKATVKFDAKAAPLKQKIADANAALTRLKKRKATPEIRAKITDFQRKRNAAVHALATLQVKKANPKLNANSADFKKKVSAAEKRLKDASKKKAEPKIKAKDETAKGVNSAKKNINSVKDHTVTIRVNTVRTTTTRKKTVPAGGSGSAPTAGGQSVMPSSVVLSTPPATVPVVQIQFNDPMLKGLISAQIQQRAQTAVQSSQTRAAVTL